VTAEKSEVLQGTLDLMILKTLQALGSLHGYGIATVPSFKVSTSSLNCSMRSHRIAMRTILSRSRLPFGR